VAPVGSTRSHTPLHGNAPGIRSSGGGHGLRARFRLRCGSTGGSGDTLAQCGRGVFDCTGFYMTEPSPVMGARAGACVLGIACSVDHEG